MTLTQAQRLQTSEYKIHPSNASKSSGTVAETDVFNSENDDDSNHEILEESNDDEEVEVSDNKMKENKNGPFRLNKKHRQIVEQTFSSMKKERMWRLSTGKYVEEELFELGKKLELEHAVHSFILDVDDVIIRRHFNKAELDEIDYAPGPQEPELSDEIIEILHLHVIDKDIHVLQQYVTGSHMHIMDDVSMNAIFEQAFGDLKAISIVSSQGERIKATKTLKDMLIKLMEKVDWDIERCSKIQTVGMIHAGMMIMTIYMDNPKGYICRVRHGETMEVPDSAENFSSILEILASVLNMKTVVRKTMKVVQVKKQTKSFKKAGFRKRPLEENQHRLSLCLPTPKKAKVCTEANVERSYPSSVCPESPHSELPLI
ncbi:hypothetical protein C1645_821191 [Glomus cerebriforme]|uniref:Uncharacterized protein n=1 Tax=Glomus cerebriforme TaxID=658196 RepID=A0A397T0W5_9GLOM|nr:hypothetical protein C1645_821191 [Glomus cerebriforme]